MVAIRFSETSANSHKTTHAIKRVFFIDMAVGTSKRKTFHLEKIETDIFSKPKMK
jgi:hypothetical protein